MTSTAAGANHQLAQTVFTIQQELFTVIQAATIIAGKSAGLAALDTAVKAVGQSILDALSAGNTLTLDSITVSTINAVAKASGYSTTFASNISNIIEQTNAKIALGYAGYADALANLTDEASIASLAAAKAAASSSQDLLLASVQGAVTAGAFSNASVTAYGKALESAIAERTSIFTTVLSGSSSTSELGNPAFLVANASGKDAKDILDLAGNVNQLTIAQIQELNIGHIRLLGSNTSVELVMGAATSETISTLNIDNPVDAVDNALFASNYTVTLKVTNAQLSSVVTSAVRLAAAGIDIIKPVSGTLTIGLNDALTLIHDGLQFASGLVRLAPTSSEIAQLKFDDIYSLMNAGLNLPDGTKVTVAIPENDNRVTFSNLQSLAAKGVSFTGGEVSLTATDVLGSVASVESKLLIAVSQGLTFNTTSIGQWKLGADISGNAIATPTLSLSQALALKTAGIAFKDAVVVVSNTADDISSLTHNAYDLIKLGVTSFDLSGGSISVADARALVESGKSLNHTGLLFANGFISNAQTESSLSGLNDILGSGLALPASYSPTVSKRGGSFDAGCSFSGEVTLRT
jgi:hypothetical protein